MGTMTRDEAIAVLVKARTLVGRSYKSRIWRTWFNGNYEWEGLGPLSSELQRVRNEFGPSFLNSVRLPPPEKSL